MVNVVFECSLEEEGLFSKAERTCSGRGGLYDKLGVANFSTYLLYVRALVFGLQMLDDVEAHVLLNGRVRPMPTTCNRKAHFAKVPLTLVSGFYIRKTFKEFHFSSQSHFAN